MTWPALVTPSFAEAPVSLANTRLGAATLISTVTAALFDTFCERHLDALHGVRQLLAGGDVLTVEPTPAASVSANNGNAAQMVALRDAALAIKNSG